MSAVVLETFDLVGRLAEDFAGRLPGLSAHDAAT